MRTIRANALLILSIILTLASAACHYDSVAKGTKPSTDSPRRASDWDGDGIPDAAELRTMDDRENFKRWFTAIAERQFYELSDAWTAEQRDCSGLVRFAWREALRKHDRAWFQRFEGFEIPVAPDVKGISLDNNPLGERLFLTDTGEFSEFADARTLKVANCVFVSRDRRRAQAGDLIFFHQPWVQRYPYHVMIFLGKEDWVVYHTGTSEQDHGEVRKVRLSMLDQHPSRRWRPEPQNDNFLGFYRLKILNQGD